MFNDNNSNNNENNNNNNKKNNRFSLIVLAIIFLTLIPLVYNSTLIRSLNQTEVTYNDFKKMINDEKVTKVTINSEKITFRDKDNNLYITGTLNDEDLLPTLIDKNIPTNRVDEKNFFGLITAFLPLIIFALFIFLMSRNMKSTFQVGKSKAKVYMQKNTGVTFKDVAGQEEAKESLVEIIDFLHDPKKYRNIGAKLPKGALLVGPPGTGKTLIAKAVAGEANVPFFSLTGSDFVEMFVGVGASRVRDLFKEANKAAPCIIFIDEIDAIGKSRDSRYGGGNDEREQTLNQLLSEMDGFDETRGLLVMGATNRPEILDKALLRPGRFDRRIIVDKPDLKGRIDTLKVHAKDVRMDQTVDFKEIALATPGAVGADLANIINEAAINAVKNNRQLVNQDDLFESVEVVIAGKQKKDRILNNKEKRIVAYHEVGHALLTALQKNAEPVQKITIIPRTMGALGYVMQVPEEEKYLQSKDELLATIIVTFGGRAAEDVVFNSITTGAANDIEQATNIARQMITRFGMSDKFGLIGLEKVENQYLEGRLVLNCADNTASEVDKEVIRVLNECYERAKSLISEHREELDAIADYLYEKETITGKQFMEIFRQFNPEETTKNEINDAVKDVNSSIKTTEVNNDNNDNNDNILDTDNNTNNIHNSENIEN